MVTIPSGCEEKQMPERHQRNTSAHVSASQNVRVIVASRKNYMHNGIWFSHDGGLAHLFIFFNS